MCAVRTVRGPQRSAQLRTGFRSLRCWSDPLVGSVSLWLWSPGASIGSGCCLAEAGAPRIDIDMSQFQAETMHISDLHGSLHGTPPSSSPDAPDCQLPTHVTESSLLPSTHENTLAGPMISSSPNATGSCGMGLRFTFLCRGIWYHEPNTAEPTHSPSLARCSVGPATSSCAHDNPAHPTWRCLGLTGRKAAPETSMHAP